MDWLRAGFAFGVLAVVVSACASAHGPVQPLVVGWERYFAIEWEPGTRNGHPVVQGSVLNDWGWPASSIQLLVEGLDPSGQVVTQDIAWLGTPLTPGMRAYFEVPVKDPRPGYRVSVFAFNWVQSGNGADNR